MSEKKFENIPKLPKVEWKKISEKELKEKYIAVELGDFFHVFPKETPTAINDLIESIDKNQQKKSDNEKITKNSDGYHTFDELYEHRNFLFCALCKITFLSFRNCAYWSRKNKNGTGYDGYIVVVLYLGGEQISYHMPECYIKFLEGIPEVESDHLYDGHTSIDVLHRLENYLK